MLTTNISTVPSSKATTTTDVTNVTLDDCLSYTINTSSTIDAAPLSDTSFYSIMTPTITLERKKHNWIKEDGVYVCDNCHSEMLMYSTPFCPWCGCPMDADSGPAYG